MVDPNQLNILGYVGLTLFLLVLAVVVVGRKNLWGLSDPIFLVFMGMVFNVANILYFKTLFSVDGMYFFLSFISFFIFLRAGVMFGSKSGDIRRIIMNSGLTVNPTISEARYLIFVAIFLQSIWYLFLVKSFGVGLITGDVSPDVKNMVTLEGNGVYKYLSIAGDLIFMPMIAYLLVNKRSKKVIVFALIWFLFVNTVFGLSKAGFVLRIFDMGMLSYYLQARYGLGFMNKKIIIIIFALGAIPAIVVLGFYSESTGLSIGDFFVVRLLDTGGGSYAYFVEGAKAAFKSFSFIDRLSYYFDTLLSVLRIKEWDDPNRTSIALKYLTGSYQLGYGQNPYLFLDGHFLFGYIGGFFYVTLLGFLFGIVRSCTSLNVIVFFVLVKLSMGLVVDPDISQAIIVSVIFIAPFPIMFFIAKKACK
jgi:hypothetical protein